MGGDLYGFGAVYQVGECDRIDHESSLPTSVIHDLGRVGRGTI